MRTRESYVKWAGIAAAGVLAIASPALPQGAVAAEPPPHIKLLEVGSEAPKFHAVDMDGKPFVFEEELAGGPVFLVFWSIF